MSTEKIVKAIKNARQVVKELIWLALDIGTLIAVITMIILSIR